MKTLSCNCRNCGSSLSIEVEDDGMFTDQGLIEMATCELCYSAMERIKKADREKIDRIVKKELQRPEKPAKWRSYKQPYKD